MTRRILLALPVALAPALLIAAPAKEVTIYLGKFDQGTGRFVRHTFHMVVPNAPGIKLDYDLRESDSVQRFQQEIITPRLQAAIYRSLS